MKKLNLLLLLALFSGVYAPALANDPAGRLIWPSEILQHQRPGELAPAVVTKVAIRPGANQAAIVGDDHVVSLVNLDSGLLIKTLKGHSDWVRTAVFTSDGSQLLTAGADRKILRWDLETGRWSLFAKQPASIEAMTFSPDGKSLAVVGFDSTIRVYDFVSGKIQFEDECPCNDMRCVSFSPSGSTMVAGGRCGSIQTWGKQNSTWSKNAGATKIHQQRIRSIQFMDEATIVSCSDDRHINLTNLGRPTQFEKIAKMSGRIFDLRLVDLHTVACCGSNNRIELVDLNKRQIIGYLEGHEGTVTCLDYANGSLVSGSYDTQARVWKSQAKTTVAGLNNGKSASFDLPAMERSASLPSQDALQPIGSFK